MSVLAINGGTSVRTKPWPSIGNASGRTLGEEEMTLLREVIESGALNRGAGKKVAQLEEKFADYMGVAHCTASTSGTAAIHVAVGAINPDPGDEIITCPVTDMGTVIPILFQNAIPVFADMDRDSRCLDPADVERRITDRTRAIIPVHLCGNATDMDPIMQMAEEHNLAVIEDSSQAYGTLYRGRRIGTIGNINTFSLQQGKHITTGDGGLTITDDEALGERADLFANKGWPNYGAGGRDYVCFGTNYRMTELQAAVTLAQLDKLDWIVAQRAKLGDLLTETIQEVPGMEPPVVREGDRHTYWFYPLLVNQEVLGISTDRFVQALQKEGAPASGHYIGKPIFLYDLLREKRVYGNSNYPWSLQPAGQEVRYEPGETPVTEQILDDMVGISINEKMTEDDIGDIAEAIQKVSDNLGELR